MKIQNLHKCVLILLLFTIAFFYGDFNGQILSEQSNDKTISALFQLIIAVFSILYIDKFHLKIRIPNIHISFAYLFLLFILCFFRFNPFYEELRLFASILLTQIIILFLSSLLHEIEFPKALFLISTYFIVVLWICFFVHINSVGIISFTERSMYNRLGGLYFYGLTGVLSGLTAILSSIGFYIEKTILKKLVYLIFAVTGLLFTLGADLRNAMAACGICLIYLFFKISKNNIKMKLQLIIFMVSILFLGIYYMQNSQAALNTNKDLDIRKMIWRVARQGISEQPLTGYGKFNYFSTNYQSFTISELLSDSHSSILNQMLVLGIPATIIFFIFYSKLVWFYYKYDLFLKGILIVIPAYWLLSTITGGAFFIGSGNYSSYIFGLSIFGILMHPDLYLNKLNKNM